MWLAYQLVNTAMWIMAWIVLVPAGMSGHFIATRTVPNGTRLWATVLVAGVISYLLVGSVVSETLRSRLQMEATFLRHLVARTNVCPTCTVAHALDYAKTTPPPEGFQRKRMVRGFTWIFVDAHRAWSGIQEINRHHRVI